MNILALLLFFIPIASSPGPTNILFLTSGVNFGYKNSLPLIAGAIFGFILILVLMSLGAVSVFDRYPEIFTGLKYVGGMYLLYLAWKIADSSPMQTENSPEKDAPITFIESALFQWLNPKVWIMAINTIVLFLSPDEDYLFQIVIMSVVLAVTLFISDSLWALSGRFIKGYLSKPFYNTLFNYCMAILLVVSVFISIF